MNQTLLIVIALAVIAVLIVASITMSRRRRSDHLKSRFGPEYEHALETKGDRSKAEAELAEREKRVEKLDIRPLDESERQRFTHRWTEVQARFVDDPPRAVAFADALLADVMKARGYPVSDFEQRAGDISVDHPNVVEHYRAGHDIARRHERGRASTEELRQAMIHYRALFEDLVGAAAPAAREKEATH
jgi:FtsZ-interacting cell division protein ZipA